jgi:hypothetical protein
VRQAVLSLQLVCSLGWIGAALAYLALGVAAVVSGDLVMLRTAWLAMALIGWVVIVPLALGSLVSGLVVALVGPWGLLQHYWVLISLVLTALAVAVTVLHMPTVSAVAERVEQAPAGDLAGLGGDLLHPGLGLLVLLVVTVLNVYKPRGRIRAVRP